MKKILYGVSGIGNGHANRQLSIIEELSRHNLIFVLAYQDSYKTFVTRFPQNPNIRIIEIAVPFIVGDSNGLNFSAIASHPFNQGIDFLSMNSRALGRVESELGVPDLAITDYEPVCAQYAYSKNVPLVTIDQQSKFLCSDLPRSLGGFTFEDEVQRLHMFFPKAAARIACSFFRTHSKIGGDEVIFMPPPIKKEVAMLRRNLSSINEILVYISSAREFVQTPEEIMTALGHTSSGVFKLFVNPKEIEEYRRFKYKNINLYPIGDPRFIEFMATCKGIISTAGHSLLSESMFLGIPVYAIPVSPYEQHINAKVIDDNAFGVSAKNLDPNLIQKFIDNLDVFSKNIRADKCILTRGIGQELIIEYLNQNFLSRKKILIFSPPFSGHLNVLKEFVTDHNRQFNFHLVITGWDNIKPDTRGIPDEMITRLADGSLSETDPGVWTLPRAVNLLDKSLKITEDFSPDLILYDFFSIEGNLIGRLKNIPYWCSVPALIGSFKDTAYRDQKLSLPVNKTALSWLKDKYNISLNKEDFEIISDGLHLSGQINLIWSFKEVTPGNFMEGRSFQPYVFVGNPRGDNYLKSNYRNTKPMIYISFGTVVMDNLWNNSESLRMHLKQFIQTLTQLWSGNDYQIIFSTQGKKVLDNYPQNWWVYDTVDQVEILSRADLFITHGGSNSFHEAVMQKLPMLVIPFFGDQLLVAENTEKLGFGKNVGGSTEINTHNSKNFLNPVLAHKVVDLANRIISDYSIAAKYISTPLTSFDLDRLIKSNIQFHDGNLIVGSGIHIPRSREDLPVDIDGYINLMTLNLTDYPTAEIRNIIESLKFFTAGLKGNAYRSKIIEFFATLSTVHCLLGEDTPDVTLAKNYWGQFGGNIIFYRHVDGVWVEERIISHAELSKNKLIHWDRIILGSENQAKIDAVNSALTGEGITDYTLIPLRPKNTYPEQLVGLDEIVFAAVSRHKEIKKLSSGDKCLFISTVSGIYLESGRWYDVAITICSDWDSLPAFTKTSSIEIPTYAVDRARLRGFNKFTVSSVLAEEYSDRRFATNPHLLLTSKKLNRIHILADSIKSTINKISN